MNARTSHPKGAHLFTWLLVALIIAAACGLHTVKYAERNYREDEVLTVNMRFATASPLDTVALMAGNIHPPLWRVLGVEWVRAFTPDEALVRFSSALFTALTLAFVARLGADLFGWRYALVGLVVLATLPFFQFYAHDFRPYTLLMTMTSAALLAAWRWLRQPTARRAAWWALAGAGVLYTHYIGAFALAGLGGVVLLAAPRRWRALALIALGTGLLYLPWLSVFVTVITERRPGGVVYADDTTLDTLRAFHAGIQVEPLALGVLLFAAALLTPRPVQPADRRADGDGARRFLLGFVVLTLVLMGTVNLVYGVLTLRNLAPVVPAFALALAWGFAALRGSLQPVALALLVIPALAAPLRDYEETFPYRETLAFMRPAYQPGDGVVINVGVDGRSHSFSSYLAGRLMPDAPASFSRYLLSPRDQTESETANRAAFLDYAAGAGEHLWWIEMDASGVSRPDRQAALAAYYLPVRADYYDADQFRQEYRVVQYRRIPPFETVYQFGGALTLGHWRLLNDVQVAPCQTVTLESWWRADERLPDNYSLTLVLADTQGIGVANSDGEPAGILTRLWTPGQAYLDTRTLTVPCDAASGEYPLLIGLYDYDTVESLSVTLADGAPVAGFGYLTTLVVGG